MKRHVSVVIPTRNRWSTLARRALPAALAQEPESLEVIVVDNASTEEPWGSALADPRVRIVHEQSRGLAFARNAGIAAAEGDWIAFLDDDDVWAPAKIGQQLQVAEETGADFVYSAVAHVDASGVVASVQAGPAPDSLQPALLGGDPIPAGGSNVIARRSLVEAAGGFDSRLFHLADYDFFIRLASLGKAARCSEVHVGYVQHVANMHLGDFHRLLADIDYLEAKHAGLVRRFGTTFDRARFARWIASEHARAGRPLQALSVHLSYVRHRPDRGALAAVLTMAIPRRLRLRRRARPGRTSRRDRPRWLDAYEWAPAAVTGGQSRD